MRPSAIAEVRRGLAGEAFTTTGTFRRDTVYEAHYVPLRDASGAQVGLMSVVIDITERVRAAEARARADKLEALTILAGGVAHDFNNLLVGILGNAALALLDLPAESPARPTSCRRSKTRPGASPTSSRQMLAFSGRGQFVRQPVDVSAAVAEAAAAASREHPVERQLARGFAAGPRRPRPAPARRRRAHRQRRRSLFPPGVPVTVQHAPRDDRGRRARPRTHPGPLPAGDYVVVEVTDRGEGIDPALQHRIFEPFFTTRSRSPAAGSASRLLSGIARGHRGGVVVESAPGAGATFRLYLAGRRRFVTDFTRNSSSARPGALRPGVYWPG
ncbi:ATP-binding protein [Tepidiforma flava]|uniref:histidine kinase n=1 Tax=Tepidiforma flava TaxID=3004094 RepID=A0ABY7MAZ7_9CHLR|nr:ATP-binding protein [Tepidiforma flava]WBL37168.1 ATP-binding protein [Tepidiforma flava]